MAKTLKIRTANALKWNIVDKISTQILYAVTGIILARLLSPSDFGLVGAALVFQAFASLLVDSGFSYALLQYKHPSRLDYSTILWFNVGISIVLYLILYLCAPLIALWFQGDERLIPVSRVLFLAVILNALTIVQTNRLTKAMEMKGVALSNFLGLSIGGIAGISLALCNFGVWAIVVETLTIAAVKATVLWIASRWRPLWRFSMTSLRKFSNLGTKMMFNSFLNTVFLNIYSFFIGNRVGFSALGYYTQADKWSKMGTASISQVLTSSFIPALSAVQDDPQRFRRLCSKMTRLTAYLLLPAMIWLMVTAKPLFHVLFGTKWDPSVFLFQLLLARGIFVVLSSLSTNFLLAQGHGSVLMKLEIFKDGLSLAALAVSLPYIGLSSESDPVYGLSILLWGLLLASVISWGVTVWSTVRHIGASIGRYLMDLTPYVGLTIVTVPLMLTVLLYIEQAWLIFIAELLIGLTAYLLLNVMLNSKTQKDIIEYFLHSINKHKSTHKEL